MSDTEYDSDDVLDTGLEVVEDEDAVEIEEDGEDISEVEDSDEEDVIPIAEINQNITKVYIVKPENRMTSDFLSVQEQTEIVSIRAEMISKDNDCQVPIDGLTDPIKMGQRELMGRKCPLIVRREIGEKKEMDPETKTLVATKYYEYWDPNEMGFSKIYDV